MEILGLIGLAIFIGLWLYARSIPDDRYQNTDDNLGPF